MKTKNKMTIILILTLILICVVACSGITAFAVDSPEVSPTPPPTEDIGGIFAGLWETVKDFFFTILGSITLFILWLVDCMFALIGVLAGSNVVAGEKGILELLLEEQKIKDALFGITAFGAVLVLIIGVLSVFRRSTSDQHGNNGTVVKNMLKAVALFIAVPMICLALIFIVNLLIQGINLAISGGTEMKSFGHMLFGAGYKNLPTDLVFFKTENLWENMYTVEGMKTAFQNLPSQNVPFSIQSVQWLIILAGGGALLWFCFPMILMMVSRLFELVILYIFDAIPISFMPYDDGERFNHWKNEFVERFMSAYGVVLSYSLFGMLMPTIIEMEFMEGNSFFKIIIILGGAYFMNKAPQLINGLLGLKGSGIGDALGGIAMRQGMGAGVKVAGATAIGAGAFAVGKTASIAGGIKNKIAPRGAAQAEQILNRQDKLERRGAKLEQKREKQGGGGSSGFSDIKPKGNIGTGKAYTAKSKGVTYEGIKANNGYIPLSSKAGQNTVNLNTSAKQPIEKNSAQLDSKMQKKNIKLAKNSTNGKTYKRSTKRTMSEDKKTYKGFIPLSTKSRHNKLDRNTSAKQLMGSNSTQLDLKTQKKNINLAKNSTNGKTHKTSSKRITAEDKKTNNELISLPTKSKHNNVIRNTKATAPIRKGQTKLDAKIQKNDTKLDKNSMRIKSIHKEVESNSLISGADYRRNWEKAKERRKNQ